MSFNLSALAAMRGLKAISYLLDGAKETYSHWTIRHFEKSGGYSKAIEDFKSLKPYDVQDYPLLNGVRWREMCHNRENVLSDINTQRRLKSTCALAQSDQSPKLSARRSFASLAIQNAHSEDSDQTAQMRSLI